MLVYLASPYSHPSEHIREQRAHAVVKLGAELFNKGLALFIPIAQSHLMHVIGMIPSTDWENWWNNDVQNLKGCDELWIAAIDGWDKSKGVRGEMIVARELGLPIKLVDPDSHLMVTFSDLDVEHLIGPLTDRDLEDIKKLHEMTK